MSDIYYYTVKIQLMLTANKPGITEELKQEINVFCHNLEKTEGIVHVHLSQDNIACEGPEPRTAAGSLD